MRLAVVVHLVGVLVRLFGPMMLLPAVVAWYYGEQRDATGFVAAAAGTFLLGHLMAGAGGPATVGAADRLRRIEGLATVAGAWLLMAHIAAIPYVWTGVGLVDALFESMSGLTTTGATVIRDFSAFGYGMLFWRALTHWVGGMGVIALFVAVLPRLAIGGRELFFAEASGPTDEKLTPRLRQTALALWRLYAVLTATQVVALWIAGMGLFDSVCHAMSTLAAGGFSPHPRSIAGYQDPAIEWIICVFMFLSGANFALQYRVFIRGHGGALLRDEEFRAYTIVVLVASALLLIFLMPGRSIADAARVAVFHALSIITTTGFASEDFNLWNDQAKVVLLALMFIGGCAGSAAGGPKVIRHLLMARYTLQELRRIAHPRAVLPVKLGGRVVPDETMREVVVFMLFYILTYAVGATIVVALGENLVTGISGTAAAISNVGPAFNEIGPMGHFGDLHPLSKIVLTLEMWIGRLEVITVLVLFRAAVWKSARWLD